MIHVMGDSHSSVFTGLHGVAPLHDEACPHAVPGFCVRHLGPYLAYSMSRPEHAVRALVRRCVRTMPRGDKLVLVFGEIDCRNQLVKHGGSAAAIKRAASAVASAYGRAGAEAAGRRELAFLAVPPATVTQHGNEALPTVGTFAQRQRAMRSFNAALRKVSREIGAEVIDCTGDLAGARGEPSRGYFADGVHADPRALPLFLREFVRIGWLGAESPAIVAAEALSRVPPPVTVAGLPGGVEDARVARQLLIEHAAMRCRAHGAAIIAIMGAGQHTSDMGLESFQRAGLSVTAILDDAPRVKTLHGVRVMKPEQLAQQVDAVVVSSDGHEHTLLNRARQVFGPRGVPIVPIYSWRGQVVAKAGGGAAAPIDLAMRSSVFRARARRL